MSLRDLYQDMILDHGKTPRNRGVLDAPTHTQVGHNPLCGDQLTLYVATHDDHVTDVKFEGKGCAISLASASLLTEAIKGKTLAEIERLFQAFHTFLTQNQEPTIDIGKLAVFAGVAEFPMRVKCATLAWHTLHAALENASQPVTTE